MRVWKVVCAAVLLGLAATYFYEEIQFRKPLAAAEIDGLAATIAAQMDCGWPYESTRKREWLRHRSLAERKSDATFQTRFMAAMSKYQGLTPDQQCALLGKFPDLVRPWHD